MMCDRMGINVWEVIDAAATKPFGFMPFYPGPGLGGHCIPIDPFYLSWKTKQAGIEARFIELAGYINGQMPHFVVDKVQNALNDAGKPVKGSHIHVMGVAYKRDIDDMRESPALDIILLLQKRGAKVTYSDPHVPALRLDGLDAGGDCPKTAAADADCVVIITDHAAFDYDALVNRAKLIVDTRNALKGRQSSRRSCGCRTGRRSEKLIKTQTGRNRKAARPAALTRVGSGSRSRSIPCSASRPKSPHSH